LNPEQTRPQITGPSSRTLTSNHSNDDRLCAPSRRVNTRVLPPDASRPWASSGRECDSQLLVKVCDAVDGERAGCGQLGIELLWREDLYTACCEGSADQRPVAFHDAQNTVEGYLAIKVADHVDLLDDPLDDASAVSGSDQGVCPRFG